MFVVVRRNDYSKEIVRKSLRYGGFEDEFKVYDDIYLRGWDYDIYEIDKTLVVISYDKDLFYLKFGDASRRIIKEILSKDSELGFLKLSKYMNFSAAILKDNLLWGCSYGPARTAFWPNLCYCNLGGKAEMYADNGAEILFSEFLSKDDKLVYLYNKEGLNIYEEGKLKVLKK